MFLLKSDDMIEYLRKIFETYFPIKSHNMWGCVKQEYHTDSFMPYLTALFEKYDILFTYSRSENNLLYITYVDYYYQDVPESERQHRTFEQEKIKIELEKEVLDLPFGSGRSISYGDADIYPVLAGKNFMYSYFCFPSEQKNIVSAILHDTWNRDDCISNLPSDNSIAYFMVSEDVYLHNRNESHVSYLIMCKLIECNVPIIIVSDKNAKYSFRSEINDKCNYHFKYRPDIKIAPRSSWEANIARVLTYLDIPFEYESTSFKRFSIGTGEYNGYYLPDFFLPDNTILEVKGFWDTDSRTKMLEFIKHYAEYKYYIVDPDMYISIKRKYQPLINEWEKDEVQITKQHLQVVGLGFGERKKTYGTLSIGQEVVLKRDKGNHFDANAIIAYTTDMKEIGFISADWSCIYAQKMDIGMTFESKIFSIEPKVITLNVIRKNQDIDLLFDFFK